MEELTFENGMPCAPRSFWEPIEAAHGSITEFRKFLLTLERNEIIELYRIYKQFELELFSDEHIAHLEDNENVIKETASWVVMQGEKYYNEVYNDPEKTPSGGLTTTFSEEIVNVFMERYKVWISTIAFPVK